MKTIEQYERMRRSLMTAYAATFFVWAGALTGLFVFVIEDRAVPDPVALLLLIGTVGGFLGWAASGLCLFLLGRRIGAAGGVVDPLIALVAGDRQLRQVGRLGLGDPFSRGAPVVRGGADFGVAVQNAGEFRIQRPGVRRPCREHAKSDGRRREAPDGAPDHARTPLSGRGRIGRRRPATLASVVLAPSVPMQGAQGGGRQLFRRACDPRHSLLVRAGLEPATSCVIFC